MRTFIDAFVTLVVVLPALSALAQELGPAPRGGEEDIAFSVAALPAEEVAVAPNDRAAVVNLYRTVYLASQSAAAGWTGNRNTCNAGTTTQEYADATILRVNYYRAMAGLPGTVTLSNAWSAKCQEAALMMSVAGQLSHTPDVNWACSTAGGREAAGKSNLALGAAGPGAIDLYVDDHGSGNSAAGHRRWILYPPASWMGAGSIPSGGGWAAQALWVIGGAGTRPATPAWVAWPPPGFVPYQVLPRSSQRWSFSYPGATFSNTKVYMQRAGTDVALTLEPMSQGYGDNTIVWVPQGVPTTAPASDLTYTVTVSNVVVSSQARQFTYQVTIIDPASVIDTVAPRVTIGSPAPGVEVGTSSVVVTGTATDNVGVAAVEFKVLNAAGTNAWQTAQGTASWTAAVTNLYPGTNTIRVRATDAQGNVSPHVDLPIIFAPRQELMLTSIGEGTLTPYADGTNLVVGRTYTMLAMPGPGSLFSHWSGAVQPDALRPITNTPQVTFLMQTGLWLQAHFVASPFFAARGTYNGLFYETSGVRPESSGFFTLTVGGRGGYTAKLRLGATEYATSGQLNLDGQATNHVPRPGTNCLTVAWALDLDPGRTNGLTGRILDCGGGWMAELLGDRAPVYGPGEVSPFAGKYTFLLPGTHEPSRTNEPAGDGFGAVTVATNGVLSLSGRTADGKVVSQSVSVSTNGLWPLYVPLYGGEGSLVGWVQVATNPPASYHLSSGRVGWIKPVRSASPYYPEGFSVETTLGGSAYKARNGWPVTNGILTFTGGGLETPLTNCVTLTLTNTLIACGSGKVLATLTRSNGTFSGSFTVPPTNTAVTFQGAILQGPGFGSGYFKHAGQSGQVSLSASE
jgi:hypothetical protein